MYFIFFKEKEDTFCVDDSFTHSLSQFHEMVTWNGYFHLTGVSCQEIICGISCLLNVFETISCVVQRQDWYTVQYSE